MVTMDLFYITEHAGKQSGFTQLRIGTDGHRLHGHAVSSGLDDGLQSVGVFVGHIQTHGSFSAVSAKSAGCIRDIGMGCHAHGPASKVLEFFFLQRGKSARSGQWDALQ